ncbi:Alpha/beta hydrolase domain-containing protein 13 [Xylographa opegraphella]|nr:Alpha/beta hydrolase domain-containing protein 13 [Xylographa opegraphella]
MAANILSYFRIPALATSGLAVIASALLYWKQNELIYPRNIPSGSRTEAGVPRPNQFGISDFDELRIPTPDGEHLSAFFIRPSNKRMAKKVTIMMFHGNAGNIGHRVPIARVLEENLGCNVLMLEYRGYGLSSGTPNEEGLMIDAQAGLDYIRKSDEIKDNSIIIYGQSLGGAVAIQLVAKNEEAGDIVGLILENTFLSIRKMIPCVFPPARFLTPLCYEIWPSEETLPRIRATPILFISGLKDEIVPPSHMKELFALCRVEAKTWKEIPEGTHNNSVGEPFYFNYIADFIDGLLPKE